MFEIVLALALSTLFDDAVSCTVQGYVYRMHEDDPLAFSRADYCEGVRYEADHDSLVLYSPTKWVRVIVPADYGQRRLQYRWGSRFVHIGTETVPVEWGYTEKG